MATIGLLTELCNGHIVQNTVGKLCEEKKAALGIVDEAYARGRSNRNKATIKALDENLQAYRNWLLDITIVDPACGSGAFLNQALTFLILEHAYIDALEGQLLGHAFEFPGVENHILERNLFGVDINEEAIDIARLSLWLRTAQRGRKLTTLSNNIKCGNSLIDDPTVAGTKAFNWQTEFPQVFAKGGFDVVVGNPPYLRIQGIKDAYPEMANYYAEKFVAATGNYDIYVLFVERVFSLLKEECVVSFIMPHKFLIADFGVGIRTLMSRLLAVDELIHFGSELVFAEASTYTCIITLTKKPKSELRFKKIHPQELFHDLAYEYVNYKLLGEGNWNLQAGNEYRVIEKLKQQPYTLDDVFNKIFQGIATSLDSVFVFEGRQVGSVVKGYNSKFNYHFEIERDMVKPFVRGNQITKYCDLFSNYFVLVPYKITKDAAVPYTEVEIAQQYPLAYSYLKHFESEIRGRENHKMDIDEGWFLYIYPKNLTKFQFSKIMTQEISLGCNMTYDEEGTFYHPTTIYSFVKSEKFEVDEKFYLGIMNSKVMWFFMKNTGTELRGGYFRFKTNYLKPFPVPAIPENAHEMVILVNRQLQISKAFQSEVSAFINLVQQKFNLPTLSQNLQNWPSLDFKGFLAELKKAKVKLTLPEEAEWLAYFTVQKEKANALQAEITRLDKEIDQMVYQLYGLTEEEIRIVEDNIIRNS